MYLLRPNSVFEECLMWLWGWRDELVKGFRDSHSGILSTVRLSPRPRTPRRAGTQHHAITVFSKYLLTLSSFSTLLEKSKIVSLAICALPQPALAEVKALVTKDHSFWPGLSYLKMCLMQAIEHSFRLVLMCVAVLLYLLSTRNLFP